jgi:hypothetical protein
MKLEELKTIFYTVVFLVGVPFLAMIWYVIKLVRWISSRKAWGDI